jgi:hypothetical protein
MIHDSPKETKIMGNLTVGSCGWKHKSWLDSFYPDDLPEDWQLTYYANEFSGVLIPVDYLQATECDIEQWCDDAADGFSFYLLWPETGDDQLLVNQLSQFGDRLAGILMPQERPLATDVPVYLWQEVWRPDNEGSSGIAVLSITNKDLKTQRNELQQFQKDTAGELHAVFLMDNDLDINQLNEFKTLVELMGL